MKIGMVMASLPSQRATQSALALTDHEAQWCVSTGAEALRRLDQDPPELVLVSVSMSDLNVADFTRHVLAKGRTVVMLIADVGNERLSVVYEAMGAGALDVVTAPFLNAAGKLLGSEALHTKLRTVGRLLGHSSGKLRAVDAGALLRGALGRAPLLLAIGASTGGPQALLTILKRFPQGFGAAVVIVQHVDSEFSAGMASWLSDSSGMSVEVAKAGAAPKAGSALLAGSNDHLAMTSSGTFRYTSEPRDLVYRPSVDVLFSSLAEHWHKPAAAALLTGMGRDGAEGLSKLRKAGWLTLAQDEASCAVYGMPKAAALLGAACKILPPEGIAQELLDFVSKRQGANP